MKVFITKPCIQLYAVRESREKVFDISTKAKKVYVLMKFPKV